MARATSKQLRKALDDEVDAVVMEALSFVAIRAGYESEEEEKAKKSKKSKGKRKRKENAEGASVRTRKQRRAELQVSVESAETEENDAPEAQASAEPERQEFWIAQLLDDVTDDMFDDDEAAVRVTWLDLQQDGLYQYAYEELVEVQTFLCYVLVDEDASGKFSITSKSQQRIQRRLRQAKGDATKSDGEDSEEEIPVKPRKRKTRSSTASIRSGDGSGGRKAPMKKKTQQTLLLPPHHATVDASKYLPRELRGTQAHELSSNTMCGSREVIRAVLTKNYELLRLLTSDANEMKHLESFHAYQSVDVRMTALHYAIQSNDVDAVALLWKQVDLKTGPPPTISLPGHSTGGSGRGSRFRHYKAPREIAASRGGKEGNEALLEDKEERVVSDPQEDDFFWRCSAASIKILSVMYPSNSWDARKVCSLVAHATRAGNYKLVRKMVETLSHRWGFTELHSVVLSLCGETLPKQLRKTSAIARTYLGRIRTFHMAAINPDPQYLEALWAIAGDERALYCDSERYYAIHFASVCEGPAPLKFLMKERCDFNLKTKAGLTPIMCALQQQRVENAMAIIEHAAAESDDTIRIVVNAKCQKGLQPIHYAAKHDCSSVITKLAELGASVEATTTGGLTALCIAAQYGHMSSVVALLDTGANVDSATRKKKTPLMFAVKNGHTDIAATLINHGANLNAFDTSDNTVAHYAASYGWLSCVELLMDAGADFWSHNSWGVPPVISAMLKSLTHCSRYILEHDVKQEFMNFRDHEGRTLLFLQCKFSEDKDQLAYILKHGVDPNICDTNGEYPLQALLRRFNNWNNAVASGSAKFVLEACRLLLKHGAKFKYKPTHGGGRIRYHDQPIHLALQRGQREVVELLIDETTIDLNIPNSDGMSAWQTAATNKSGFFSLLLSKFGASEIDFNRGGQGRRNIFHCLASGDSVSRESLEEVISACPDVPELLNAKDASNLSPLMTVLKNERRSLRTVPSNYGFEREKQLDRDYSDMVAVFAKHTSSREALLAMEWVYLNEPYISEDGKRHNRKWCVQCSVLHLACERKLKLNSSKLQERWFGDDLLKVVLEVLPSSVLSDIVDQRKLADPQPPNKRYGSPETSQDPSFFDTPLLIAVKNRNINDAELLLAKGADPNISSVICTKCNSKQSIEWGPCNCPPPQPLRETPLIRATAMNDVGMVKLLLSNGASVGCISIKQSQTPVHLALGVDNDDLLAILTAAGASVNDADETGKTPLHLAVELKRATSIKILLSNGANPKLLDKNGNTPLLAAIKAKYSVNLVDPHAGKIKFTPLDTKNSSLTKLKKSYGLKDPPTSTPSRHQSDTHNSGFGFGQPQNSPFGASTPSTTTNSSFGSASTIPARSPNDSGSSIAEAEVMEALLDDLNVKGTIGTRNKWLRTPIHYAAQQRDLRLLRALIHCDESSSSLTNARDAVGRTPLHFAVNSATMAAEASFEVERFLMLCGADVNAADDFGCTPLHFALFKVNLDWHIEYDEKHSNESECSAMDYEEKKRNAFLKVLATIPSGIVTDPVETVSNLAEARGISVTSQDELGRSALHLAAATGAAVSLSSLLESFKSRGALEVALELKDKDGYTPLACAFECRQPTTIATLMQSGASITELVGERSTENSPTNHDVVATHSFFYYALKYDLAGACQLLLSRDFSRRQAMEDALQVGDVSLANNLMGRMEVSRESHLLADPSAASGGETLMHFLAKLDHPFNHLAQNVAWRLVDNGLDTMALDARGNGAIHYAAEVGNVHVMDFLLHHKGNINQVTRSGESPLLFALKRIGAQDRDRLYRTLDYVVGVQRADVTSVSCDGSCALSTLLQRFSQSIGTNKDFCFWVEMLLRSGADPNRIRITETVPLFDVLQESTTGNEEATNSGGDATEKELFEKTASLPVLSWLSYLPHKPLRMALMALFIKYGALVSTTDDEGNTVIMHLLKRNMPDELRLVLGGYLKVQNLLTSQNLDASAKYEMNIDEADVAQAICQKNQLGDTALHVALSTFGFASFEDKSPLYRILVLAAKSPTSSHLRSIISLLEKERPGRLIQALQKKYDVFWEELQIEGVSSSNNEIARHNDCEWHVPPDYESDSAEFIQQCKDTKLITETLNYVTVNHHCNASKDSYVLSSPPPTEENDMPTGNELNVLLTKVDTSHGPFGINVFYRLQVVHDKVQMLYIVFTNWGRIGEVGNFQNTPFKSAEEAIKEFKKIFRSKTGNDWDKRETFTREDKKYNLVRRVDFSTNVSKNVTRSIAEEVVLHAHQEQNGEDDAMDGTGEPPFAPLTTEYPESAVRLLLAVTDIQSLQLSTPSWSSLDSCDLPLAVKDELSTAVATLQKLKVELEELSELDKQIQEVSDNITDDTAEDLVKLSDRRVKLVETVSETCSRYLEIMPYNESRSRRSVRELNTVINVNEEIERVHYLMEIKQLFKILIGAKLRQRVIHPLEYCVRAMQVKVFALSSECGEAKLLTKYFFNGIRKSRRKQYRVTGICELERRGERERTHEYLNGGNSPWKLSNEDSSANRLLWHGTRRTNLMSIFLQGLRISPADAPSNGSRYGRGIYFADVSEMSLGFCDQHYPVISRNANNFGSQSGKFYLLLAEVSLGNPISEGCYASQKELPKGFHSVHAIGNNVPNPQFDVISTVSGAVVPIGKVGRIGEEVPLHHIWVASQLRGGKWLEPNTYEFSRTVVNWLDVYAQNLQPGNTEKLEGKGYTIFSSSYEEVTIELMKTVESTWEPFDTTLLITRKTGSSSDQFKIRRYHMESYETASGFSGTILKPKTCSNYSEFVVFNEAQARIRYAVEVELKP